MGEDVGLIKFPVQQMTEIASFRVKLFDPRKSIYIIINNIHSGTTGKDEVFSFRRTGEPRVSDGANCARACASNGLPPDYFSAHSLR